MCESNGVASQSPKLELSVPSYSHTHTHSISYSTIIQSYGSLMPRFRYIAVNPQGESLTGEIDSADPAVARESLMQAGLRVNQLQLISEPTRKLSVDDGAAISQQIAAATQSELPLVGSLRAYAEEVFAGPLQRRLYRMCDALEAGEPLERVLSNPALQLPSSVSAILGSGLPPVAMNHLLSQTLRASTTTFELRSRAALLVIYSLIMFAIIFGLWSFLLLVSTPHFKSIFEDFGTELPPIVVQLIFFSDLLRSSMGLIWLAILIPIGVVLSLAIQTRLSKAARRRFFCGLPIIGAMYRLTALSEYAKLLALMLESDVPLPQAVVWSAAGTSDADLQECSEAVAARLRWGEDPITASQTAHGLPAHLQQMLRWAAHGAAGAEPLRSMATLLEIRAKSLSMIALPLMEPVLMTATVASVGFYVIVIFLPLIKLLNDLS
ncbi:MAG: Type secretion system domain protein [Planctomycetaceae bacterium]|nr:Type secretion system domain protein [Planctomycetaceae bacterium]